MKTYTMATLTLREIIWEITNICNKNCEYCGSKEFINVKTAQALNPIDVAKEIAKYPPKEITLSGGEPGTLSETILKEVTDILKAAKITVKCVTNGLIIDNGFKNMFDWVGLSINSEEDLEDFDRKWSNNTEKLTIITNFGTHNIWLFDKILKITRKRSGRIPWQIQLTEGKFQLPAEGIKHLRQRIKEASEQNAFGNIVEADNLQACRNCRAGINSCGITYHGDIIPCLSMRSWTKDLNIQGNIIESGLEKVWKEKFCDYRFGMMPCCRDCIDYGEKNVEEPLEDGDDVKMVYGVSIWDDEQKVLKPTQPTPIAQLYGVVTPPNGGMYVYGVWPGTQQVMSYACYTPLCINPDLPTTTKGWEVTTNPNDNLGTMINGSSTNL